MFLDGEQQMQHEWLSCHFVIKTNMSICVDEEKRREDFNKSRGVVTPKKPGKKAGLYASLLFLMRSQDISCLVMHLSRLCVCVCVFVCVCVCVFVCVCVCVYVCLHAYRYIYIYIYLCLFILLCIQSCLFMSNNNGRLAIKQMLLQCCMLLEFSSS